MAASTMRYAERGPGPGVAVALLLLFGALAGVGIAIGEVEAMLASVALLAALAALIDFRAGAVVLMVLLPISAIPVFPRSMFGFTGLNPINVLMAATLVSFLMRGRQLWLLTPKPLLLLYVLPVVGAALLGMRHVNDIVPYFFENELMHFSDGLGYLRDILLKPMFTVVIAMLVGAAVAQSKRPEGFLAPIILAVWVMSLTAIGYVLYSGVRLGALSSTGARDFFSAIGMHANDLGRLYAVAYALLLFTWGESKETAFKTMLVVTMGVLSVALLLTFSRGAFVGFMLINGLYLLWKFNSRTVAIALLIATVAMLAMPGAVMSRLEMGFGSGGDANAVSAGRIDEIWLPLLNAGDMTKSPIWGSGLDSILWSNAGWSGTILMVGHPHNAYLQAWLDMGAIGLLLMLAYFVHVYRGFRSLGSNAYLSPSMRGLFQGATAGLLCFLLTGFSGSSLRATPEFVFLWFAIGMMYGMQARIPERTATGAAKPA
jgi:O-antigen ligase